MKKDLAKKVGKWTSAFYLMCRFFFHFSFSNNQNKMNHYFSQVIAPFSKNSTSESSSQF